MQGTTRVSAGPSMREDFGDMVDSSHGSQNIPFPLLRPEPLSLIAFPIGTSYGNLFSRHVSSYHRCLLDLGHLLRACFEKLSLLAHVPRLEDQTQQFLDLKDNHFINLSNHVVHPYLKDFCNVKRYFNDADPIPKGSHEMGLSFSRSCMQSRCSGRPWTNVFLVTNILAYIAEVATRGKLFLWGAKINSLIDQGQLWRLITCSFLHADIPHLMVNCYSLNAIGPTVEKTCGSRKYLTVYFTSAITSSTASYLFCKAPAIGASGAILGLVACEDVLILKRGTAVGGGRKDLHQIAKVLALNMVIGIAFRSIDNSAHIGGFLGGAIASWLLG